MPIDSVNSPSEEVWAHRFWGEGTFTVIIQPDMCGLVYMPSSEKSDLNLTNNKNHAIILNNTGYDLSKSSILRLGRGKDNGEYRFFL